MPIEIGLAFVAPSEIAVCCAKSLSRFAPPPVRLY